MWEKVCPDCGKKFGTPSAYAVHLAECVKNCPFCGSAAALEEVEGKIYGEIRFSVGCLEISGECIAFQFLTTYPTRKEAIAAWNKRV